MKPVITPEESARLDAAATDPVEVLMERAGLGVALAAARMGARYGTRVLALAGPGNNGGDAYAAARFLRRRGVAVEVRALAVPGSPWILTIIADSDLMSGTSAIPIGEITWTASPSPPFQAGTLSTVVPSVLGSGLSHFTALLTLSFYLRNSWSYEPGHYAATATLTLSSP